MGLTLTPLIVSVEVAIEEERCCSYLSVDLKGWNRCEEICIGRTMKWKFDTSIYTSAGVCVFSMIRPQQHVTTTDTTFHVFDPNANSDNSIWSKQRGSYGTDVRLVYHVERGEGDYVIMSASLAWGTALISRPTFISYCCLYPIHVLDLPWVWTTANVDSSAEVWRWSYASYSGIYWLIVCCNVRLDGRCSEELPYTRRVLKSEYGRDSAPTKDAAQGLDRLDSRVNCTSESV